RRAVVRHPEPDRSLVLVGLALVDEPPGDLDALLLAVELERDRPVPVQAEPAQRVLDLLRCLRDLPARVRVLDPQAELAPCVPGEEPVEERRANVSDMQEAGRARGHADPDAHAPLRRRQSRRLRSLVSSVEPTLTPRSVAGKAGASAHW